MALGGSWLFLVVMCNSCWLIIVLGRLLVIYDDSCWFLEVPKGFLVIVDGS